MDTPIKISVGGREVIAAGNIMTRPTDESVSIKLDLLTFRLVFESTEDKKLNVDGRLSETEPVLTLALQNFDSPLGISYFANVGSYRGKSLSLDLFVHSAGDPNKYRLISYAFSLGEAQNG